MTDGDLTRATLSLRAAIARKNRGIQAVTHALHVRQQAPCASGSDASGRVATLFLSVLVMDSTLTSPFFEPLSTTTKIAQTI